MYSTLTFYKSLILPALFFLAPLFAQADGIFLSPDNLPEVLDKVLYLHNDEISISSVQIDDFLQKNIQGDFENKLKVPVPEIIDVEQNAIRLEWLAISDADRYIIRYLNLNTNEKETFITTTTNVKIAIPNDLYLITFQIENDDDGKSKSRVIVERKGTKFIIIEDKPLSSVINETTCQCQIPVGDPIVDNVGSIEDMLYPYNPEISDEIFHVNVYFENLNNTGYDSDYYLRIVRNQDYLVGVGIYHSFYGLITGDPTPTDPFECTNDMDLFDIELSYLYALNTDFPVDDNEFRAVRFSFENGLGAKIVGTDYQGTVTLQQCFHELPELEFRLIQSTYTPNELKIYPNPTTGIMTLDFIQAGNIPPGIQILNNYGQVVRELPANRIKMEANIEGLPAGLYYLRIVGADEVSSASFVKL